MDGTLKASTSNTTSLLSTRKSALHSAEFFFRDKISRMPSAGMEDFVEHKPRKALKILRRL